MLWLPCTYVATQQQGPFRNRAAHRGDDARIDVSNSQGAGRQEDHEDAEAGVKSPLSALDRLAPPPPGGRGVVKAGAGAPWWGLPGSRRRHVCLGTALLAGLLVVYPVVLMQVCVWVF